MSYGLGRPHSSDAWSSQRTYDFSTRMHSVPRYNKGSTRYSGKAYAYSPYDSDESSWNAGVYSPQSGMSGECSHRFSARSLDRVKTKQDNHELKRKMVFVLHDEIRKAPLTCMLEEISDIDIITEMCLTTMAAMLKSKTHRKFLYHRNNNALVVADQHGNLTSNSILFKPDPTRKDSKKTSAIADREALKKSALFLQNMSTEIQNYSRESEVKRKQREEEIMALRKLKEKLAPIKKKGKGQEPETETRTSQRKSVAIIEDAPGSSSSKKSVAVDMTDEIESKIRASMIKKETMRQFDSMPPAKSDKRKNMKLMTIEEVLKCKWLRLSTDQVEYLEATLLAEGKDPGIHAHCKIDILKAFEKDKDDTGVKFSIVKEKQIMTVKEEVEEEEEEEESTIQ